MVDEGEKGKLHLERRDVIWRLSHLLLYSLMFSFTRLYIRKRRGMNEPEIDSMLVVLLVYWRQPFLH